MSDETEDAAVLRLARARRIARGLRVAARRALRLARKYREEEGPRGARERACVTQALAWRAASRSVVSESGPGLARAGAAAPADARRTG